MVLRLRKGESGRQAYNSYELRIRLVHASACTRHGQTLDCKRWTSLLSAAQGSGIAHLGRSLIPTIALIFSVMRTILPAFTCAGCKYFCYAVCRHVFYPLTASLRCRWQTRATRWLTPIVLCTDINGQCDKLMTDYRHHFITLTVHLRWQHLRRSTWQIYLQPLQRYGWCPQKFKWFTWPDYALSGMVCHQLASTFYCKPT